MVMRIALLVLVSFFFSASSFADEYVLRIETVGYRNLAESSKAEEKPMDSIEVIAKVDEAFFGKAAFGNSKITMSGKLKKLKDGRIRGAALDVLENEPYNLAAGENFYKLFFLLCFDITLCL